VSRATWVVFALALTFLVVSLAMSITDVIGCDGHLVRGVMSFRCLPNP
jgi:hypothetical protein